MNEQRAGEASILHGAAYRSQGRLQTRVRRIAAPDSRVAPAPAIIAPSWRIADPDLKARFNPRWPSTTLSMTWMHWWRLCSAFRADGIIVECRQPAA